MRSKFQFLIGTIKTWEAIQAGAISENVSIPYRYYKNEDTALENRVNFLMFQFLIGTIKTHRKITGIDYQT